MFDLCGHCVTPAFNAGDSSLVIILLLNFMLATHYDSEMWITSFCQISAE